MKILIIGGHGQVGWELHRSLLPLGRVVASGHRATGPVIGQAPVAVDLADPDSIRHALREVRPEIIVNAAAYTAVDQAEHEPEQAMAINGIAPGIMAEQARALNATLIHYSTDYVFDGTGTQPYRETDAPDPCSVYGKTKLAGEQAVAAAGGRHLILRTAWVYGNRGKNFFLTMKRLAAERDHLRVVNDQTGAPTWSRLIAQTTAGIISQSLADPTGFFAQHSGIYHLTSNGHTTWHGFARAILDHLAAQGIAVPRLEAIPTTDYPLPAARPAYSVLNNAKLESVFKLTMPSWESALQLVLQNEA